MKISLSVYSANSDLVEFDSIAGFERVQYTQKGEIVGNTRNTSLWNVRKFQIDENSQDIAISLDYLINPIGDVIRAIRTSDDELFAELSVYLLVDSESEDSLPAMSIPGKWISELSNGNVDLDIDVILI